MTLTLSVLNTLYCPCCGRVITLGVLVPHNGSRSMGAEAEAAIKLAMSKVCFTGIHPSLVSLV